MSVIKHVISEEHDRLKKLIRNYEKQLKSYPKGSVVNKKISGKSYSYIVHRDEKKVKTTYIGKSNSDEAKKLSGVFQERRRLEKSLREAKINFKDAKRFIK
jgi:hypothetical protein